MSSQTVFFLPCARLVRPCPPHYPRGNWKKNENGSFTLKTHRILDLCLRKSQSGKSYDYRDTHFRKAPFTVSHKNEKPVFSKSSVFMASVNDRPNRRNEAAFHNFFRRSADGA